MWLVLAGLLAGYINAMAGAGSLLTLPALIFSGLGADVANATNRIAVLFQTMATSYTYRRSGVGLRGRDLWICLPAGFGTIAGSYVASQLSAGQMQLVIALVMAAMVPALWLPKSTKVTPYRLGGLPLEWGSGMIFFAIGFYIGFIQAAAGILILLYLGIVRGVSLVYANALKVAITMLLTVLSLAVFVMTHVEIDLKRGLILAVSTAVGGVVGARMAVRRGEGLIRIVLSITIVGGAVKLIADMLR